MCEIRKKNNAAIYILSKLYDGSQALFDNEKNVKLMKLIYLTYIQYISLFNPHTIPDNSPLKEFKFYAWDRGGVEIDLYDNFGYIRRSVKGFLTAREELRANDFGFQPHEINEINRAIQTIRRYIAYEVEALVKLVHQDNTEWRKTPKFERMLFANGYDKEIEIVLQ